MTRATLATAIHRGLIVGRIAAAILVFLTLLHADFHILSITAGLGVFHFAFVFAAAVHGLFAFGLGVMAATLAIFHLAHVMTAALCFGSGRGTGGGRCRVSLRPDDHR